MKKAIVTIAAISAIMIGCIGGYGGVTSPLSSIATNVFYVVGTGDCTSAQVSFVSNGIPYSISVALPYSNTLIQSGRALTVFCAGWYDASGWYRGNIMLVKTINGLTNAVSGSDWPTLESVSVGVALPY